MIDKISKVDYRARRLDKTQARKRILEIANRYPANIIYSKHALKELKKDNLTISDVLNVIKSPSAKIIHDAEFENGSYRYRLETSNIVVVLAFESGTRMIVVTAWRRTL